MKEIIRILGSLVLTTIMYCVPILLTCSICLGWDDSITMVLVTAIHIHIDREED